MIILYGGNGSPFVSRVRMQALAKDLPLELRRVLPGSPEIQQLNPLGKVPVLEHDGFIVVESAVISEYLEDAFPTPSLLGSTLQERARARLLVRTLDLYCIGMLEMLRAKSDPGFKIDLEAKRAALEKGLDALETFLGEAGGDGYAVAGKLSIADCALVPWLFYGNMWTQSGEDSLTRRPRLARYTAFITEQELPKRILSDMDEAFRAFMARWKEQQAAAKAT